MAYKKVYLTEQNATLREQSDEKSKQLLNIKNLEFNCSLKGRLLRTIVVTSF